VDGRDVEKNSVVVIRWIARMWGSAIVALVVLFAVMHAVSPDAPPPTTSEWVGLAFFPMGVCAGLVLAWRWEGLGGGISVGSYAAFYAWMFVSGGGFPSGPYFSLAAVPGALFVLCRLLSRDGRNRASTARVTD
jgi:hypothetical protein